MALLLKGDTGAWDSSAVALKQSQEGQLKVSLSSLTWFLLQLEQKSLALEKRAKPQL